MDIVVDNLELLNVVARGNSKEWGLAMHPRTTYWYLVISMAWWLSIVPGLLTFSRLFFAAQRAMISQNVHREAGLWLLSQFVTISPHCAPRALLILAISQDIRTPLRFPVNTVGWLPSASSPVCRGQSTRNPSLCISQEECREGICLIP